MRQIKFKIWNKKSKIMSVEVTLFHRLEEWERGMVEIMQYTGLLDKNGKEIFEGDILEVKTGRGSLRDTIEIGWATGGSTDIAYGFIWSNSKNSVIKQDGVDERYEIIGNVFENPELLTK